NNARKVHALMKELGYPPDDITLARKIIGEHFPAKSKEAIAIAYKRALSDLLKIDRWVSLVRKWGGHRYDARPQAARDEVDDLIAVAGPKREAGLDDIFTFLERQQGTWACQKLRQLRRYRNQMKAKPRYWPPLVVRPSKRKIAVIAKILKLMETMPER